MPDSNAPVPLGLSRGTLAWTPTAPNGAKGCGCCGEGARGRAASWQHDGRALLLLFGPSSSRLLVGNMRGLGQRSSRSAKAATSALRVKQLPGSEIEKYGKSLPLSHFSMTSRDSQRPGVGGGGPSLGHVITWSVSSRQDWAGAADHL